MTVMLFLPLGVKKMLVKKKLKENLEKNLKLGTMKMNKN
jgi:hypothetical protein